MKKLFTKRIIELEETIKKLEQDDKHGVILLVYHSLNLNKTFLNFVRRNKRILQ